MTTKKNNIDIAREWGVVNNHAELVTLIDWCDDGEEHGDQWPAQLARVMRLCVEAGKAASSSDLALQRVVGFCLESREQPKELQAAWLRDMILTDVDPMMIITQRLREKANELVR